MDITSPFFVVPLIVVVFFSCILWSTSSKEDTPSDEVHVDNRHAH
jgi:hypothetical protein